MAATMGMLAIPLELVHGIQLTGNRTSLVLRLDSLSFAASSLLVTDLELELEMRADGHWLLATQQLARVVQGTANSAPLLRAPASMDDVRRKQEIKDSRMKILVGSFFLVAFAIALLVIASKICSSFRNTDINSCAADPQLKTLATIVQVIGGWHLALAASGGAGAGLQSRSLLMIFRILLGMTLVVDMIVGAVILAAGVNGTVVAIVLVMLFLIPLGGYGSCFCCAGSMSQGIRYFEEAQMASRGINS
ncbi:uncharacterized protein AMSG_12378 [Thecamonas trahens ATCC 50062]|uniref:Uncharacterized protein n=1 Tax=Thecamonas trahens ATCC 50062 TaxID=461836 RepID=A0A0L0DST9_THETB|nr:hypothetical protein AMSG_12378 [Thecamonas trahens ATCC 50062]KNC55076.1 hypothetical protein AMSG_12378 [Thecamonas trahens ATCC 50062]|eukprot:XP_013753317.1 hypothetical protein AMSG_12378 [Thecamonas trahens ATCC 50062]